MDRKISVHLEHWKNKDSRKPLLLRGARQVGKTYVVREFAKNFFGNLVEINFELQPQFKALFKSLDSHDIVSHIQFALGQKITPGQTLLFLDEIQECPQALASLRYFHEQMGSLHVIAAGSLIEFLLKSEKLHVPVGRMEYLYMHPLDFTEFLNALNENKLEDYLDQLTLSASIPEIIDHQLNRIFRNYLLVGGMPEVVQVYRNHPDSTEFQGVQNALIHAYRDDFGKYASRAKQKYLQKVYLTAPSKVGEIYKYSHVDREVPNQELKTALNLLADAGIVAKVHATSAHGLPLMKTVNEKKFKILFMDVGLMQRACGLEASLALNPDIITVNAGAVAEQFIGQQLLSSKNPEETPQLYFWSREKRNSQAEIDFLAVVGSAVIPIEVKAGKTGTLRSLKLFMEEHKTPLGVRFSQQPLSFHDRILSLPLYAVGQMERMVQMIQHEP